MLDDVELDVLEVGLVLVELGAELTVGASPPPPHAASRTDALTAATDNNDFLMTYPSVKTQSHDCACAQRPADEQTWLSNDIDAAVQKTAPSGLRITSAMRA